MEVTERSDARAHGQSLVEFALVATPFFLLLFSVIGFGLTLSTQVGLSNAARETARYASTVVTTTTSQATTNATFAYSEMLQKRLPQYVVGFGASNLVTTGTPPVTRVAYCQYLLPSGTEYGTRVIVMIEYRQPMLVPLIGAILDRVDGTVDSRLRLTSREEMRVESPPLKNPPGLATC